MGSKEVSDNNEFFSRKSVYFVGSSTDDTVLVAIRPHYDLETKMLTWWDTIKERKKHVRLFELQESGELKVVDESGDEYLFVPLNIELYKNVVRGKLTGKRDFSKEGDMVKAFEETVV